MGEDERYGIWDCRTLVNEMNINAVDAKLVVIKGIYSGLYLSPFELMLPIIC